jgi:hypothetical protein
MAIAHHHNSAKLQLRNSLLTTLYSPTPTTTTGTSSISLRASQEKLTDFQSRNATATGSEFKTNTNNAQRLHINDKLFGGSSSSKPSTDTLKQQEREEETGAKDGTEQDPKAIVHEEPEQASRIDQEQQRFNIQDPRDEELTQLYTKHTTERVSEEPSTVLKTKASRTTEHPICGPPATRRRCIDVLVFDTVKGSR